MRPIYLVHYDFLRGSNKEPTLGRQTSMQSIINSYQLCLPQKNMSGKASAKTVQHETRTKRSQLFENDMLTAAQCWLNASLLIFSGLFSWNGLVVTIARLCIDLRILDGDRSWDYVFNAFQLVNIVVEGFNLIKNSENQLVAVNKDLIGRFLWKCSHFQASRLASLLPGKFHAQSSIFN